MARHAPFDEDHVEAAAGQFSRAPQRVEVGVAAAEGYRGPVGLCAHAHLYIP